MTDHAPPIVPTQTAEIVSANILEVEAGGTQGGGNAGDGGRTYFRLKNSGATAWSGRLVVGGAIYDFEDPDEIEIWLGGDTEQQTFVEALRFAADAIEGRRFPTIERNERYPRW